MKQDKKTRVSGMSLGGALALLTAIDQGDKLSVVNVLNPPGLYEPFKQSQYDHWDEFVAADNTPKVCIKSRVKI